MNIIKLFMKLIKRLDRKKTNTVNDKKKDFELDNKQKNTNRKDVLIPGYPPENIPIVTESSKKPNLIEVNLSVVGLKYDNEDGTNRQDILKLCKVKDSIQLIREPMDKYPNAIQVQFKGQCIGYISEEDNKRLAKYIDKGGEIYEPQISYLYMNSKGLIATCEIIFWRNKMR